MLKGQLKRCLMNNFFVLSKRLSDHQRSNKWISLKTIKHGVWIIYYSFHLAGICSVMAIARSAWILLAAASSHCSHYIPPTASLASAHYKFNWFKFIQKKVNSVFFWGFVEVKAVDALDKHGKSPFYAAQTDWLSLKEVPKFTQNPLVGRISI